MIELNQLPDGSREQQKRRTQFDSVADKLEYDAENLIQIARRIFRKIDVSVQDVVDFVQRQNKQELQEIRTVIAVKLKVVSTPYEIFIDGLGFAPLEAKKLKIMVSEEHYQGAVSAAQDLDPNVVIPSKAQICEKLMTWDPQKLREICQMQARPRVVIETANSFEEQVDGMDVHKYYVSKNSARQRNAQIYFGAWSPYLNGHAKGSKPKKVMVSITDAVVHPATFSGAPAQLGEKVNYLKKIYAKKGMKFPSRGAMAALYQMSLKEAKESGDNTKILDHWENGEGTLTLLEPRNGKKSYLIACSSFNSYQRRVEFMVVNPGDERSEACGRASVVVLEG